MMLSAIIANRIGQSKTGIHNGELEIEAGGLERVGSCLKRRPQEVTLLLQAGEWRLDVWKNKQREAFMKDSGMRALICTVIDPNQTAVDAEPVGSVKVQEMTTRGSIPITVDGPKPSAVKITFSTFAMFKPVRFHFVLTKLDDLVGDSRSRGGSDVNDCNKSSCSTEPIHPMTAALLAEKSYTSYSSDEEQLSEDAMIAAEEEDELVVPSDADAEEYDAEDAEDFSLDAEMEEPEAIEVRVPRYSLEWLERQYKHLTQEDKFRMANAVRTAEAAGWPSMEGACAAYYDNSLAVKEMARESSFKAKAREAGLIRPFLLLVSMHPGRRVSWALSLGLKLTRNDSYGDAHWESYQMLTHVRRGIVPLASRTFREQFNPFSRKLDWNQLLFRTLAHVSTTKQGLDHLLSEETMAPKLLKSLKTLIANKNETKDLSARSDLASSPEALENLFARQFHSVRIGQFFDAKSKHLLMHKLSTSTAINADNAAVGGFDDEEQVEAAAQLDMDQVFAEAVEIVREDPEMAAKAAILRKHGYNEETSIALVVLNAFHKHSTPVKFGCESNKEREGEGDVNSSWNKQWGSNTELLSKEFKTCVAKKIHKGEKKNKVRLAAGIAVPMLVSAITLHPTIGVIMCSRAAIKAAFPTLPASVASVVSSIILQRSWLAVQDIGIEDYYGP